VIADHRALKTAMASKDDPFPQDGMTLYRPDEARDELDRGYNVSQFTVADVLANVAHSNRLKWSCSRCQSALDPQNGADTSFQVPSDPPHPRLAAKALLIAVTLAASLSSSGRRPRLIPCSFARASPASTRSRIMARSNSAKTPII
jgi:hypothetical protein